jgi:hypothetical protein
LGSSRSNPKGRTTNGFSVIALAAIERDLEASQDMGGLQYEHTVLGFEKIGGYSTIEWRSITQLADTQFTPEEQISKSGVNAFLGSGEVDCFPLLPILWMRDHQMREPSFM